MHKCRLGTSINVESTLRLLHPSLDNEVHPLLHSPCYRRKETDEAAREHPLRRMLSNRGRSGVGALDAMNAASNAISKAVKTPNMGSAKFATAVGTKTSRVAASAHSG